MKTDTKKITNVAKELIPVPACLVTIDSESTLDIDDAISVENLADGSFRIVVCIADPTGLVPPGCTEDENAKLLGATVYVRDKAVRKMLPARISESAGSLVAGQERKAFVFEVLMSADLEVQGFKIQCQTIKVSHRLSYEDIPAILVDKGHPCYHLLGAASTLAHGLLAKRRGRGALALYDLQRMIYLDEEGRMVQLARQAEVVGHVIVQETMVLANTLLARYLVEHEVPALFRNHLAKPAAPPASDIAQTVETWFRSGSIDADRATEMFAVMLGKASYDSTVRGHFALAEACYTHGTSPLRRYADLVNLRQLKRHLKGLPFLHQQEELAALGEELTFKAAQRKEERSEGFKDVVKASAERALERGTLHRLADHELVQAIKLATGAGAIPDVLSEELCRRLARGMVTDKITDALFVALPPDLWPAALREAFVSWVALIPTRAVHLLMHGDQTGYLQGVNISSAGAATSFEGVVTVTFNGQTKAFRAPAPRKKDAEQAASTLAVLWLVGTPEAEVAATLQSATPNKPAITGNPKGALMELCQKRGWQPPTFTSSGQGPSHAMVFECEALLTTSNGGTFRANAKGASSKKEAEAFACAEILTRLNCTWDEPSPPSPSAPDAAAASDNPIGALQEMAQKGKWTPPAYTFEVLSEVPPRFRATVTTTGPKAGRYTGEATTKQEAKTLAALRALKALD